MYNRFIAVNLGECLYSVRDYIAFAVGMSSIAFWIMCQLPQFISNCKKKSVAALSVWFLLQWFAGDFMNLVGCFLTNQLLTQKATAMLYIVMDVIVLIQWLYYAKCRKKSVDDDGTKLEDPVSGGHSNDRCVFCVPCDILQHHCVHSVSLPLVATQLIKTNQATKATKKIVRMPQPRQSCWPLLSHCPSWSHCYC